VLSGGAEELVSVGGGGLSVTVSSTELVSVEVELSEDPVVLVDVELVRLVQLEVEVTLERSVPFRPAIRPGSSLAGTKHVVVVLALPVAFERNEVSVTLAAEAAVRLEASARHAGGGVGMSLKEPYIRFSRST
jgi:hypothetical protein